MEANKERDGVETEGGGESDQSTWYTCLKYFHGAHKYVQYMYANLTFKKEKTFLLQADLANVGFSFLVAGVDCVL